MNPNERQSILISEQSYEGPKLEFYKFATIFVQKFMIDHLKDDYMIGWPK